MNESPASARAIRPLEMHSPNAYNIERSQDASGGGGDTSMKSPHARVKGMTPSSPPRMMPLMNDEEEDGENRGGGRPRDSSFRLSPIGRRVDFGTPAISMDGISETPIANSRLDSTILGGDMTRDEGARMYDGSGGNGIMNTSFPDNRDDVEIHSPEAAIADDNEEDEDEAEETEEERMQREIEESEALARQLMAEEAMASYAMGTEYLRHNADQFSSEDFAALQAAMAEEDPDANYDHEAAEGQDEEGIIDDSQEMSYDALLRLGEQIGDVKEERWALVAREKMNQLPTLCWKSCMAEGKEENHTEVKCQVCQFTYEENDVLRRLPCGHCFHKDCVDSWLETKDTCAFCRKSIVATNAEK